MQNEKRSQLLSKISQTVLELVLEKILEENLDKILGSILARPRPCTARYQERESSEIGVRTPTCIIIRISSVFGTPELGTMVRQI